METKVGKEAGCFYLPVFSLPIRDGNDTNALKASHPDVVFSLPIRDGNNFPAKHQVS